LRLAALQSGRIIHFRKDFLPRISLAPLVRVPMLFHLISRMGDFSVFIRAIREIRG
jgi:hypothetical protein